MCQRGSKQNLKLVKSSSFDCGVVVIHYEPNRNGLAGVLYANNTIFICKERVKSPYTPLTASCTFKRTFTEKHVQIMPWLKPFKRTLLL